MMLVFGVIGLVALAGAVALAIFIGKGSKRGTALGVLMAVLFAVSVAGAIVVQAVASIFYVMPVAWMVALAGAVVVALGLFAVNGAAVRWEPVRLVALVGLAVASAVVFGMVAMYTGPVSLFPIDTRARQIAEASGFVVLLPSGQSFDNGSLPVDVLSGMEERFAEDKGVWLAYKGFQLEERKVGSGLAQGTLAARLRAGLPRDAKDAKVTTVTVLGQPGMAADYTMVPTGPFVAEGKTDTGAMVLFETDGVDVRLSSTSGERESNGQWVPFDALTVEELVRIAETLKPSP
ncbi:MAG TPA: hypothetical protein VF902_06780 [Coriobacteriia bacterium]